MSSIAHRVAAPAAHALRSEAGLARLALGIGALHVVDDNFLQPQPGTSAVDHLPGGLIQTAFFVLLAWAYPRLRPPLLELRRQRPWKAWLPSHAASECSS